MFREMMAIAFLAGIFFLIVLFPIFRCIDYKLDCKRWGEETAREVWRRF